TSKGPLLAGRDQIRSPPSRRFRPSIVRPHPFHTQSTSNKARNAPAATVTMVTDPRRAVRTLTGPLRRLYIQRTTSISHPVAPLPPQEAEPTANVGTRPIDVRTVAAAAGRLVSAHTTFECCPLEVLEKVPQDLCRGEHEECLALFRRESEPDERAP